ncbi:DUF1007 family protein [Acerihabitans arboris]|uniref:DUF1007 family protein n=1 Tax=Acerihabitans arboris TaxID=2691583 RepID=A0A845SLD3_9GAMM|nr:DUF1007 family protein [Acerihabitans arboris]NDL65730.1 DUF1007 family protein [Acerihabitans arboris]
MLYHNGRDISYNESLRLLSVGVLLAAAGIFSRPAYAHPHSFIDMKTDIQTQDDRLTGLKMTWTMDEITSADVFYDAGDAKPDSVTWKKLAAEIMANVLGQHYFTEVYRDGKAVKFDNLPTEYHLERVGLKARLMFVLPLAHPPRLEGAPIVFSTFDPTYFVDMTYDGKQAISLPAALAPRCGIDLATPAPNASLQQYALSLDKADAPQADMALGKQFAQRVTLQCR